MLTDIILALIGVALTSLGVIFMAILIYTIILGVG